MFVFSHIFMLLYPTIITNPYRFAPVYFFYIFKWLYTFPRTFKLVVHVKSMNWIFQRNLFDFKGLYFLHLNNHDKPTKTGIIKAIDMSVLPYVWYLYCILIWKWLCMSVHHQHVCIYFAIQEVECLHRLLTRFLFDSRISLYIPHYTYLITSYIRRYYIYLF